MPTGAVPDVVQDDRRGPLFYSSSVVVRDGVERPSIVESVHGLIQEVGDQDSSDNTIQTSLGGRDFARDQTESGIALLRFHPSSEPSPLPPIPVVEDGI